MSDAAIGYDIEVAIEDAIGSAIFVDLLEVESLDLPESNTDEVEVTHMKSPNRTKEFIAGLIDPGDFSVTTNWIQGNATDVELNSLKVSGEKRAIRITFEGGEIWTFTGYVKGYKPDAPIGDKMMAVADFRVTGSTAITPAP